MSYPLAYWPGDQNPASFQTLTFNASTNTLTLTPFGNTINITPTSEFVSSINASTINTSNLFVDVTNSSTINSYITNSETTNTSTINSSTINTNVTNTSTINSSTINTNVTNTSTINSSTINTSSIVTSTINTSNINVSTINGIPTGVNQWINPAFPINVSTVAASSAIIPIASISTVNGHSYRLSFEYGASNAGGGTATDVTDLVMSGDGLSQGVYIDSWTTQQTYTNRYTTASGIQVAAGAFITLNVSNPAASGNVQVINGFRLWSEDIGFVTARY